MLYEGYAPHGVALLIETATDNPTRTVAHVRNVVTKHGGNLGTAGSVSFQFRKMGVFRLDPAGIDPDELELAMIDHGLDEMGETRGEKGEPQLVLRCAFEDFGLLQEALEARHIAPLSAEHEFVCTAPVELPEEPDPNEVLELIDRLEQEEDVQRVFPYSAMSLPLQRAQAPEQAPRSRRKFIRPATAGVDRPPRRPY